MKVQSIEPLEARIAPAVLTITPVAPSTDEGNTLGSTTNIQFKISMDTIEGQDVTVLATAFAGTAFVGEDFAAFAQTIVIPKGQSEVIFSVPIRQDKTIEADETFSVKLSSPSANAFLGPDGTETAIGGIKNDDKPTLTLETPAAILEGSAGGLTHLTFKIKLDQKSATPITLKANPGDGTATAADNDYVDGDIDITIPAGVDEWTFTVPITQDFKVEGTETFTVELIDVSNNAFLAPNNKVTATIMTDDLPTMRIENATVVEGANGTSQMKFKVVLQGEAPQDITFDWFTAGTTATAGADFTNIERTTATIPAGSKELELIVNVLGDTTDELDETLSAFIQFAKMGTETIQITGNGQAIGKIQNDDLSVSLVGPGTVTEQTAGENGPLATIADYTLTLSGTSNHAVIVELEFVDGTAKAGSDFTRPANLTITIPANSVSPGMSTISVPITIDQIFEGDQTFQVRIKSVTNAVAGELNTVTTTILDDEVKPTLSVVAGTVPEGKDAREVQVTVSLSGRVEDPVTFDWSTLDGTALAGLDYEAVANRTATIAAGALSTTLVLKLLGDEVWESDEKLSIVLSNVSSNAIPGSGGSGVVTIDEREAAPALTVKGATAAENGGTITFTVSMPDNTVASEDITFDWTTGPGTAIAGVDYSATPTTVTIPAGQRSATFTITLLDDAVMETDETFLVTIGNAIFDSGGPSETAVPIAENQATGRILNDERQVSISTGTLVIAEQNGATGETASMLHYVINLTDGDGNLLASDRAVTITLDLDSILGTAEANDVEFPNGRTVTIPAGATSVGFDVKIRGDVVFEGNETLVMKIADVTNASIRDGSASTTITDEEGPVKFVLEDQKVSEGNVGIVVRKYKVKLNGPAEQDITFDWSTADGTAMSGSGLDYTQILSGKGTIVAGQTEVEIEVVLSGDTSDEGDEHFFLNFSNVQMEDGTPVALETDSQAKLTIQNDETVARIAGASMLEGTEGQNFLVFDVSLLQASAHDVTLTFAVGAEGDLAKLHEDYELPEFMTVTIPHGQTHGTISIPLNKDSLSEANETLTVRLTDSENAPIDVATATGTILDDDVAPELSIDDVTMSEGDAGTKNFAFKITLNKASGQDVKVLVTPTAGTATLSEDFTGQAQVITIPAGATEALATFNVSVKGDTRFESDETFSVVLSNATGATVSSEAGTGTGTIENDDAKPVLTIANVQVNTEGNSGTRVAQFTVQLSEASNVPVKFNLATANGTATAGSDYLARAMEEFTIPAGTTSLTYNVTVNGDVFWEGNETFFVKLTDVDPEIATTVSGDNTVTATGLIVDDEAVPTLSIADLTVAEGANGSKEIEVLVTMSTLVGSDVTFDWSLLTGSTNTHAALGSDFNIVTPQGQITIPAGQNTAKIKFTVNGDTADELDETFKVDIANAMAGSSPVTIAKNSALVTLQNDEIQINVADVQITEGDTDESKEITFKIVLSGSSLPTQGVTVNYTTQDGTAQSTGAVGIQDFEAKTGSIIFLPTDFLPGAPIEKTVSITVFGDTNFDSIDQFKFLLTSAVNGAIIDGNATGTILDGADTRPVITIKENQSRVENADEIDGDDKTPANKTVFTYTVEMDRYSDEPVSVNFATVAGTALAGTDFTALNQTVTFQPGSSLTQTVKVEVLNDSLYEENETFTVALSNPLNGTLGADKERTGTIVKDNDVAPTLKVTSGSIVEGDAGSGDRYMEFLVQRTGATGADLSFKFSALTVTASGDTALAGTDYDGFLDETFTMTPSESSKIVKVKLRPDGDAERDETFTVRISEPSGATIADADREAKGTILDDDVKVSIKPGTYTVSEGNAGQRDLVFDVELDRPSPFETTITYTTTPGTATNTGANPDYQNPTLLSIVIPAGETAGQIRIPVVSDSTAEDNETLTVTLTGAANAELASTNTSATGTILNDDASLIISDGQLVEGGVDGEGKPITAHMLFTVSLKDATAFPVTVHYVTSNGSATAGTTAGSDYTLTQGDLAFVVGGPTTLQISVPILGDDTSEAHETFTVTLSAATGATILDDRATGTILDDDNAHLSISDMSTTEGNDGQKFLEFKVTLSGSHEEPVTVDYRTIDGTAKSFGPLLDYLAQNGTLTFAPSEIEKTISIPIIGDTWKEVTENFTVKLSNARLGGGASGISIDDDTATGQIMEDGDASIGLIVNHAKKAEGASGNAALTFTIETTAPVTEEITFKASTRSGTAGSSDFTGFAGDSAKTIKIAAGSSTTTVTVNVTGDGFFEESEFFYLDVTDFGDQVVPVAGGGERVSAFGVILNDDINIINGGREFEFVDADGDLVHVKLSKGTLSVPTSPDSGNANKSSSGNIVFSFNGELGFGGRTLDLINLANDGLEFEGASITVTSTPQNLVTGEVLGTGKTSVGTLQSMNLGASIFDITNGVGLNVVKIDGDLGSVIAGSFAKINGIRRLEVDQFGVSGASATQSQSVVFGPLGRLVVHGDFLGSLAVVGDAADQPYPGGIGKIGTLIIDGALRGGSGGGSGQIGVTSKIGKATIGSIVGGSGGGSGLIFGASPEFNISIGNLKVLGDVVGGTGANSGAVLQVDRIGSVAIGKVRNDAGDIEGNLVGGSGVGSGVIGVGLLGSISINGDVVGGAGEASGQVNVGKINKARVEGDLTGGTGKNSGRILMNALGSLFIGGDIAGAAGENSGSVGGTTLGKTQVEGSVIGGGGKNSGRIEVTTTRSLLVDGSIVGGAGENAGSVLSTKSIGSVHVTGDVDGGAGQQSGVIIAGVIGGKLIVEGDLVGGTGSASGVIGITGYTENFVSVPGRAENIIIGNSGDNDSGNIIGGDGDSSGLVFVAGNLKNFLAYGNLDATDAKGGRVAGLEVSGTLSKAVIKGSMLGGNTVITSATNRGIGSAFVTAGQIGSLTIEGSVKSGVKDPKNTATVSNAFSAGIHSNSSIKTLKILGLDGASAIEGNKDAPVMITATERIGNVTIGGDVQYAEILAGYNRTADLTKVRGVFANAGATIDSVTVDGKWTASSLVAGVFAGADGKFGTADDTETSNGAGGTVANQDLISKIASVVIKSTIELPADAPADASYGIVAEWLQSVKVNGEAESLERGAKNDPSVAEPVGKTQIFEISANLA